MRTGIGAMAAAMAAACGLTARVADAQDVQCPPHQGATTVTGNLLIAAPCELDHTRVRGNVRLFAGGSLRARDVRVDGNLEAHTAFEVELVDSRVEGNIELIELVGDSSAIVESRVDGSIQLRGNRPFVRLDDNEVNSDIAAYGNTGGLDIIDNEVGGDLKCDDNDPVPTGDGNEIRGDEEGQCSSLVALDASGPSDPSGADTPADSPDPSGEDSPDPSGEDSPAPSGEDSPAPSGGDSTGDEGGTDTDNDPAPFNPINDGTTGSGGGSMDLLTLLAASLLLLGRLRTAWTRSYRIPWARRPR